MLKLVSKINFEVKVGAMRSFEQAAVPKQLLNKTALSFWWIGDLRSAQCWHSPEDVGFRKKKQNEPRNQERTGHEPKKQTETRQVPTSHPFQIRLVLGSIYIEAGRYLWHVNLLCKRIWWTWNKLASGRLVCRIWRRRHSSVPKPNLVLFLAQHHKTYDVIAWFRRWEASDKRLSCWVVVNEEYHSSMSEHRFVMGPHHNGRQ